MINVLFLAAAFVQFVANTNANSRNISNAFIIKAIFSIAINAQRPAQQKEI